jgi:hypothetical protein
MNLSTRLKIADDVTFQSLGRGVETVILSLNSGVLYSCNDTTAAFLSAIDGQRSLAQVIDELLDKFDVSRAKLTLDVQSIANKLLSEKLIKEVIVE